MIEFQITQSRMCTDFSGQTTATIQIRLVVTASSAEGEGGARPFRQALACRRPAGPRSRRGPGVQPFTPDPAGPSGHDPLASGTINWPMINHAEGPAGSGRVAGWTLGGGSARCAPPAPGSNHGKISTCVTVSRASRPARSRSGAGASAGRSKRRRVRAVSARLEVA